MPECRALTNHICIDIAGRYTPCCRYRNDAPGAIPKIHSSEMSPMEYYSSSDYNAIRNNMASGWDPGCVACEVNSMRTDSLRDVMRDICSSPPGQIDYLEISLGTECNLACRMCSEEYSSKWAKFKSIAPSDFDSIGHMLEILQSHPVDYIKCLGGEPFITPRINEVLKVLTSSDIKRTLHFHTNLTVFPKKYIPMLDKLNLRVGLSIDGIGGVNEYIRHGSVWPEVWDNLKSWSEYVNSRKNARDKIYAYTVYQALNLHDIPNIMREVSKLGIRATGSNLYGPPELSINALPPEYVNRYRNVYTTEILRTYRHDHRLTDKLKLLLRDQDLMLGKRVSDYIQELAETLGL